MTEHSTRSSRVQRFSLDGLDGARDRGDKRYLRQGARLVPWYAHAKRNLLEEIGGFAYIADLMGTMPSAAHGEHYAGIVREKALLRVVIDTSRKAVEEAYGPHESAQEIVNRAEERLLKIQTQQAGGAGLLHVDGTDAYERLSDDKVHQGTPTEFIDLDAYLNGLQDSEMIVIAARPSMGKTALGVNLATNIAASKTVAFFSLEMNKQALEDRIICGRAHIDSNRARRRMIRNQEYDLLRDAALWMDRLHLWIDDSTGLSPQEVRVRARRLAGRCASQGKPPLGLVVVDYLQLMESGQRTESRQVEVTRISNGLKAVAKDLRVPVVALAQLNRGTESRDGHRPRLSDLRESGAIEQDADVVLLLHREDYYKQNDADYLPTTSPRSSSLKLTFNPRITTFQSLSQTETVAVR